MCYHVAVAMIRQVIGVNTLRVEPRLIRAGVLTCVLLLAALEHASPQDAAVQSAARATDERLLLALSNPEYPVTPGDTYLLSYSRAVPASPAVAASRNLAALGVTVERVSQLVVVSSDYTISLGVFGVLTGRGLRFNDLRRRVVSLVEEAYQTSIPELLLIGIGAFEVHVRGEVSTAVHVATWGLGRLSEILSVRLTGYGSIRDVRIERAGTTTVYDLFQAYRFGIRSQDPYLAPGDRICVSRLDRVVTIGGQVRRGAAYQLLPGEGLAELVVYAGGPTPQADLEQIRIDSLSRAPTHDEAATPSGSILPSGASRDCDGEPFPPTRGYRRSPHGSTRYTTWDAALARELLQDQDVVTVASRDALLPVVFFEGAVTGGRLEYRYRPGQKLFDALQGVRESVATGADLGSSTFVRIGEPEEPIDLDLLLHGGSRTGDRELQPLDRIIIPPRRFEVALRGEVTQARQLTVSPLTRLSEVVDEPRTPYTSIRRIKVESANGEVRNYDLFRWRRFGDLDHNPLLRPGATVTFRARDREVQLSGQVRRPGTYQLLAGDGLAELIEEYGEGFTIRADPTRLVITRHNLDDQVVVVESVAVDFSAGDGTPLRDGDLVAVPNAMARLPVVYVEGALVPLRADDPLIGPRAGATTGAIGDETTAGARAEAIAGAIRRVVPYRFGATVFDVIHPLRHSFSRNADLGAGYVIRGAERLPVDLERLVFGEEKAGDLALQPYDTVVIPVRRRLVVVSGAVNVPGALPYVPDRTAAYYIGLAGGRDRARSSGSQVILTDAQGRTKDRSLPLAPDDQIFVPVDSLLYHLNQMITPVVMVGTLAALIALIVTIGS